MASEARGGQRLDPRTRRSVVALLASVFCSTTAIAALTITLGKQVFDMTGREIDLGLLGLAEFAPALLLVFVSGTVADRLDRRAISVVATGLQGVCCIGLTIYAGTSPTSAGPIFLLVIAYGVFRAFAQPATRSLPADTVSPDRMPWLVARRSVTWQVGTIVGPVIAGFLYAVDVQLPYLMVVVLLFAAAAMMAFVRTDARDAEIRARDAARLAAGDGAENVSGARKPVTLRDALEGIRFVRENPVLLSVISLDLFAVLFGGAVALLPAIAEERLGVGAVGLGWLRAAVGIGAASVTVVLTFKPVVRRVGRRLLWVVALFGFGTIVLGLTTNYAVAWIALAVLSGADAVSVFIRSTIVPLLTPADKRGRVLAVEVVFVGASNELGAFESGVVGQLLGPAAAVVLGGAATVVVAAIYASRFPALRNVDRFPSSIN